ncbi:hypothetical protein O9929_11790 [Vibrio lentus]|nr:hypothetical protein [Vibrio lentus]
MPITYQTKQVLTTHTMAFWKTISANEQSDQWFYRFIQSERKAELSLEMMPALESQRFGLSTMWSSLKRRAYRCNWHRLDLESITQLISNYSVGKSGIVLLVDKQGTIKVHPDKNPQLVSH